MGIPENITPYMKGSKKMTSFISGNDVQSEDWKIYQCRHCQMWLYAIDNRNDQLAIVYNNMISG